MSCTWLQGDFLHMARTIMCGKWILIYKEEPTLLKFAYLTKNETNSNILISMVFYETETTFYEGYKKHFCVEYWQICKEYTLDNIQLRDTRVQLPSLEMRYNYFTCIINNGIEWSRSLICFDTRTRRWQRRRRQSRYTTPKQYWINIGSMLIPRHVVESTLEQWNNAELQWIEVESPFSSTMQHVIGPMNVSHL